MRRILVPAALAGLAFLTGCGTNATAGAGPDAAPAAPQATEAAASELTAKLQKLENMVADCMKKQGFQYVPQASAEDQRPDSDRFAGPSSMLEPPDQVRKFREKYGFGVYARFVYPNDPAVKMPEMNPAKNPNNGIRDALDPGRRKAYDKALNGDEQPKAGQSEDDFKKSGGGADKGCYGEAYDKVKPYPEHNEAADRKEFAKYQSDPKLNAAAQKYADCLRGKGYKVRSAKPGDVEYAMPTAAMDGALPDAAGPDGGKLPDAGEVTAAVGGSNELSPEAAKAGLQNEVKAALADLDCRGDFAEIVRAKYPKVGIISGGAG